MRGARVDFGLVMGKFLAFLFGLAGAVAGSQAPGFTLQYMQNLQGRVDELTAVLQAFDGGAAAMGGDREGALAECRAPGGAGLRICQGYVETVDRRAYLTAHLAELEQAGAYMQPLILARSFDPGVVDSVVTQFKPAIPTTGPGAAYAGGGFAGVWLVAQLLFGAVGGLFGGGRDRGRRRGAMANSSRMNASDML